MFTSPKGVISQFPFCFKTEAMTDPETESDPELQGRCARRLPPKVVENHDVGVHVEEVVAVRGVVVCGPLLWLGALVREQVVAMFGLIVHTVKSSDLHSYK